MSVYSPIGVFDSGVGGLSVLKDVRKLLPQENFVYVADSGHAPYGDKTPEYISARALAIGRFLVFEQQVKAIVVACNTATSAAVKLLRSEFHLPIIAMEPAVKPAVSQTKSGIVGVMATQRTVVSENFLKLLEKFGSGVEIIVQPCPGLAEHVEAGRLSHPETQSLLRYYVEPLIERGVDTIVLGCTHYPFLAHLIQNIVGIEISILDPGEAIARELQRRLIHAELLNGETTEGNEYFWTSGDCGNSGDIISRLWVKPVSVQQMPRAFL